MSLYHTLKLAFEIGRPLNATQLLETAIAHDNHAHELRAAHAGALSRIEALQTELEKRTAENAELRKDAERWKFLCEGGSDFVLYALEADTCYAGTDACDQAIDAAITGAAK